MFWTTLLKNQSIHSSTTTTPMRGKISDAFVRMERSRMPVPNSSGASMGRLNWLATSPICNRTECERSQQQWLQLRSISEASVRVERVKGCLFQPAEVPAWAGCIGWPPAPSVSQRVTALSTVASAVPSAASTREERHDSHQSLPPLATSKWKAPATRWMR